MHICIIHTPNFDGRTMGKCITRTWSTPPNTNLFTGLNKRLPPPPPHRAHSYIQTQHGERGNVGVVRERGKTVDDRAIKAELHPPHQAGRQATVHPSRLLLMAWASKNLWLLSHPVRIRVIATMLVTRLKRRRNWFLRQQSQTLRRRTLRCRPSLRYVAPAT